MSTIIKDHFETLWEKAAAPNSPQIQKQESERMFYAGFASCYGAFMAAAEDMPEPMAELYLNGIRAEIKDYFKLLSKVPPRLGKN